MADHSHDLPPVKIAFIIDGTVIDVLHTDERLAAIFLSEPTIVDVTDNINEAQIGATYDAATKKFTPFIPDAPDN